MNWRVKSLDDCMAVAEQKGLHRSLGAFQLTMLGVGAVIGTGIFVLTAEAAQKAGPGMMLSFVIGGFVCAVTALCYAELSSMVPVSGSAYTYAYSVLGEAVAWLVGWALILEYAVAASAVSVGWSNYFIPLIEQSFGFDFPQALSRGYFADGFINLPAVVIALATTFLLLIGTHESARVNAILVAIKICAISLFIALSMPVMNLANFEPFAPLGFGGISAAAASIFFAYVGFDAVSTAAEETRNPQRNLPIALIASLVVCTLFYLLVAAGAIGATGAQPVLDPATGGGLSPGSEAFYVQCGLAANAGTLACSDEPLAYVLRQIGWERMSRLIGLAAFLALPSVILTTLFGQTRIFFAMSRDRLLPDALSRIHPKFHTPHVVTLITGGFVTAMAAFFPVGKLADISNSGTLFAFFTVSFGVMALRRSHPDHVRHFRTPFIGVIGPLALLSCFYLFVSLSIYTQLLFLGWTVFGFIIYCFYGYRRSPYARREIIPGS